MIKKTLKLTLIYNGRSRKNTLIRIKGICRWRTGKWNTLLEKKGLRLYMFLRLVMKDHDRIVKESSTLDYLFNHIL